MFQIQSHQNNIGSKSWYVQNERKTDSSNFTQFR